MFINMGQFLSILGTFELMLHFGQLFSSNLQSGDELYTNHKQNYFSENAFCSKNDKIVTDIFKKSVSKKEKSNTGLVKRIRTIPFNAI